CLGRPRHVQLLLLLGDVGKHRTKALVLDDGSLIDLRPLVEGFIREVHAIVPDRKSAIGSKTNSTWSYCSVRFLETVRSSFQAKASSRCRHGSPNYQNSTCSHRAPRAPLASCQCCRWRRRHFRPRSVDRAWSSCARPRRAPANGGAR